MLYSAAPPFPSPQAADPITRLQLLLTNFSNHFYDILQQIPETAPPLPLHESEQNRSRLDNSSGDSGAVAGAADSAAASKEETVKFNAWIVQSANNMAAIMQAIEREIERLPHSNRNVEEVYRQIACLEQQNLEAGAELEQLTTTAGQIRLMVRSQLKEVFQEEGVNVQLDEGVD